MKPKQDLHNEVSFYDWILGLTSEENHLLCRMLNWYLTCAQYQLALDLFHQGRIQSSCVNVEKARNSLSEADRHLQAIRNDQLLMKNNYLAKQSKIIGKAMPARFEVEQHRSKLEALYRQVQAKPAIKSASTTSMHHVMAPSHVVDQSLFASAVSASLQSHSAKFGNSQVPGDAKHESKPLVEVSKVKVISLNTSMRDNMK